MKTTAARARPGVARPRTHDGGFTLVEVMIALAILGTTAVVLLERRTEIVREASRSKDRRALYVLASRKLAELELDRRLWASGGGTASGSFGDDHADDAGFFWEAQVLRQPVDLTEPGRAPDSASKPKEVFRLSVLLRAPSLDEPVLVEGLFPLVEPKPEQQPPPPSGGNP